MNIKSIGVILIIIAAIGTIANGQDTDGGPLQEYIPLKFTRSDGSIYQIQASAPYPRTPTYIGTDANYCCVHGIGSKTNAAPDGSLYHIDISKNELILGDGFEVGILYWNGTVVDVITHYGFCIDNHRRGWLATVTNDGDNQYLLFQVDLDTAVCTLIDFIDPGNTTFPVNGLVYAGIQ